ncbi:collagen-like triple helix repeat-containing protein [Flagellimonas onchidii]|uniref:collagen-like triple helix repeat-containing protein n=1 Tax=Flagellimonas onchidii TaxID=2562684 RepID=UPI0010A61728|nr:collagen-like protein [Allomuricauda onchidii]
MSLSLIFASCSKGENGEKGAQGEQGIQGEQGDPGKHGDPGKSGEDGIACWDLNGNGSADIDGSVTDEDVNDDGVVDALDCHGDDGDDGTDGEDGIACWDLNGDGIGTIAHGQKNNEDLNFDNVVDVLDCQGQEGNANVTRVDVPIPGDFSGFRFSTQMPDNVLPLSDYAYQVYIKNDDFPDRWIAIPGPIDGSIYTRLSFQDQDAPIITVTFYNSDNNSFHVVAEGDYEVLRYFAIKVNPDQASGKGGQQALMDQLKAAGVNPDNYNEVAAYFGYKD